MLLRVSEPSGGNRGFALWNLGFRPFYLAASLFSAVSVALWVAQYVGYVAYLPGPAWHGGEMVFGYTAAVIAGFLLTAARNWTGRPTPTGAILALLTLAWIASRVLAATPLRSITVVVNAGFVLAVAIAIAVPLARAENRRNYFFIALLAALGMAALMAQLPSTWTDSAQRIGLRVGLDLVLFIITVMGGRVIPMFTNNGVPGAQARRQPLVEKAALGGVLLLALADLSGVPDAALAALTGALAIAHGVRWWLWQPWRTLRSPLVWILHAAYAWIVVHLVLRAVAAVGEIADPIATHALTVGGIGGLTLGMMTRTARGHTGRELVADRADLACYLLVMLAALVRVFGPLAAPSAYRITVVAAGLSWSLAFTIYFVAYAPFLLRERVDGKLG
jgi:uncharacterized protein involved in response to NO